MTIFEKIQIDLAAITDAMVQKTLARLSPKPEHETELAVISDPYIHRLWCLAESYGHQGIKLATQAHFEANDTADATTLRQQASYFDSLADVVRNVAWVEMKTRANSDRAWDAPQIGLRAGFTLVAPPDPPPGAPPERSLRVSAVSLPGAIADSLKEFMTTVMTLAPTETEDDDDTPPSSPRHRRRAPRKPQ